MVSMKTAATATLATLAITATIAACTPDNTPPPPNTPQTGATYTPPPLNPAQKHSIREQLQQAPDQWEQQFCAEHPDLCTDGHLE